MMPPDELELRATAYHEAGHAVAAFVLRRPIRTASVEPGEDTLGRVEHYPFREWFRPDANVDPRTRYLIKRHVLVLLAGALAEERVTGSYNAEGAGRDHELVVEFATRLAHDDEELQLLLDDLDSRAVALLARNDVWRAVEAVAEALVHHGHLSGREVRAVIEDRGLRPGGRVFSPYPGALPGARPGPHS